MIISALLCSNETVSLNFGTRYILVTNGCKLLYKEIIRCHRLVYGRAEGEGRMKSKKIWGGACL